MWFKQVTPFRVFELPEAERLKTAIAESWFCSPSGLDWFSEGFCSPVPFGHPIIFEAQKSMLINLMREEKYYPVRPSNINWTNRLLRSKLPKAVMSAAEKSKNYAKQLSTT